jgi:hypothetical protein
MRGKNLSLRRRTSIFQRLIDDQKGVTNSTYIYFLREIGSVDQTPVFFDMPRITTV